MRLVCQGVSIGLLQLCIQDRCVQCLHCGNRRRRRWRGEDLFWRVIVFRESSFDVGIFCRRGQWQRERLWLSWFF